MNIFDYAMKMEKDGEAYYRGLAAKTGNVGLSNILNWLADEEVKHYYAFSSMKDDKVADFQETNLLQDAKNVFQKMQEEGAAPELGDSQTEAYRNAQEMEKQTIDFYGEKAQEMESEEQKMLLGRIIAEEKRHFFLLENLVEFVSKPDVWVEHAEFNHLDEYYE